MSNEQIFNKLVRDKIPEKIEKNGEVAEIEILNRSDYIKMLDLKLFEECHEIYSAENNLLKAEELADLLEVIYAIADTIYISIEKLEEIRIKKQQEKGAFKEKILLKKTYRRT